MTTTRQLYPVAPNRAGERMQVPYDRAIPCCCQHLPLFNPMILSVQEVADLLGCSPKKAAEYMREIRKKYDIEHVTKFHVSDWLKVDFIALEAAYCFKVTKNMQAAAHLMQLRETILHQLGESKMARKVGSLLAAI